MSRARPAVHLRTEYVLNLFVNFQPILPLKCIYTPLGLNLFTNVCALHKTDHEFN